MTGHDRFDHAAVHGHFDRLVVQLLLGLGHLILELLQLLIMFPAPPPPPPPPLARARRTSVWL